MSYIKKVIRNIFSNWIGLIVGLGISFFLAPFVVHKLGNTFYGIWVITMQLSGYLGLLEVGVRSSVIKFVAEYHGNQEYEKLNNVVSSSITIYTVMAIIALLITVVITVYFPAIFNISSENVKIARWVIIITGINIALGLVFNVFFGILMGLQRYDIFNKVSIVFALIRALLIVILLEKGYGIIALAGVQLIISITTNTIAYFYCKKQIPLLKIQWFLKEGTSYRLVFNYSIISFIIQISIKLIYYTDAFVIGIFLNASAITYYAIAGNLIEYLRKFLSQMTQVLNPLTSELYAKKDFTNIQNILTNGTKFSLLIALPICTVFLTMGHNFISLWMGVEYADKAEKVLWILTITHLFSSAQYTTGNILYGLNRHKIAGFWHGIEAIINLFLSIILVQSFGIVGVALGTAIPHLILMIFIFPFKISKEVNIHFGYYLKSSYLFPFLSIVPFALACIFLNKYYQANSLILFFIQIILVLPIYLLTIYFIAFNKYERNEYLVLIRNNIPLLTRRK